MGMSVRAVAKQLGVARATATARVDAGLALWQEDPDACQRFMAETLAGWLSKGDAAAVLDALAPALNSINTPMPGEPINGSP